MSKWHAVIDLPKASGGRRRQLTRSFDTKTLAEAWLADTLTHTARQADLDTGPSLGEYLTRWLDEQVYLRPSTKASYRTHIDTHLTPALGEIPLGAVSGVVIERLAFDLAGRDLAAGTVQRILATLRSALTHAARTGLIAANPATGIRFSARVARTARTWTPDEAAAFLATLGTSSPDVLLRLALTTGMRRGELLGLRWSHLSLAAGCLRVVASRLTVGGRVVEGPPKSRNGVRTVYLDAATVTLLNDLRITQEAPDGREGLGEGLVFTDALGRPLTPWWVSRYFSRMVQAAGLPRIRFHDLRHTSATLGLASGESLKEVSARLGHSGIAITADIYADVLPDTARRSSRRRVALMTEPTLAAGGEAA
jgi:integrase